MKRLLTAILVLALAVPAFGKSKSNGTTINYGSGGTTVKAAIQQLDEEFDDVYSAINELYKMQAGTSDPSDNATNDLFLNTNTTPPVLEYFDGDSFEPLQTNALSSGLTLDAALANYSSNMIVKRSDDDTLIIAATAEAPATIAIDNDELYQNTSDTTYNIDGGLATGYYDVLAEQDGTSANFALKLKAIATPLGAGERIVGKIYWVTDTNVLVWVFSSEQPEHPDAQMPYGFFFAYATNASQTFSQGASNALVALANEYYDHDSLFNNTGGNYKYAPTRPGLYHICANITTAATNDTGILVGEIYVDGTSYFKFSTGKGGTGNSRFAATGCFDIILGSANYIQLYGRVEATDGNVILSHVAPYDTAMWGYYLGRRY